MRNFFNFSVEERGPVLIFIVVFTIFTIASVQSYFHYRKDLKQFRTLCPEEIVVFKIYPRFMNPTGTPVEFRYPDAMLKDFFHALSDIKSYHPTHDNIESLAHCWFLQVETLKNTTQIEFRIPSGKGQIVTGRLNRLDWFQSRQLYQWYQTYSHR